MGIKGFTAWFRKQFPSAYVPRLPQYDHVYIDVAPFLYLACKGRTEDAYFNKLFRSLDLALTLAKPQKSVLLALDGPAPLAKLLLQRRRRRVTLRKETQSDGKGISLLGLTPGTPFMERVAQSLQFYACQRLQNSSYHGVAFEISGATVPGEGEMKMANRLRAPWPDAVVPGDTHLMIGGDSDLTLIAMLAEPPYATPEQAGMPATDMTLHVAAEPTRGAPHGQQNLATARGCFDVGRLDEMIAALPAAEGNPAAVAALKLDLAACIILAAGNDYLPAVRGFQPAKSGLDRLWDCYLGVRATKRYHARPLVKRNPKTGSIGFDCGVLAKVLEKRGVIPVAAGAAADAQDDSNAGQLMPADASEYLQGILWVLDMYVASDCPDYRFTYERESPSAAAILEVAKSTSNIRRKKLPQSPYPPPVRSRRKRKQAGMPLSPAATALAMLPGGELSDGHAPEALKPLLQPDSPLAKLYEVCDTCEALATTSMAANNALMYAMKAAEAAGIDAKGIKKRSATARTAAARSVANSSTAGGGEAGSGGSDGGGGAGSGGSDGSGSDSSSADEGGASDALPDGRQRLPSGDVEALVLAAKQAVRAAQHHKTAHLRAEHPYEPFPIADVEAAVDGITFPPGERSLRYFGEAQRFRHAPWTTMPLPPPPSKRFRPLLPRLYVARDRWARGGEPALQQPGERKQQRRLGRKPRPKPDQEAAAAGSGDGDGNDGGDGNDSSGSLDSGNGSGNGSGSEDLAAEGLGRKIDGAAGNGAEADSADADDRGAGEAAVMAAADPFRSGALGSTRQPPHQRQVLSTLSSAPFGGSILRSDVGGARHLSGGQPRGFSSHIACSALWRGYCTGPTLQQRPAASAPACIPPLAEAVRRVFGGGAWQQQLQQRHHQQQPCWQPPPWQQQQQQLPQRRPCSGGSGNGSGSRQLLAFAQRAQRWVRRPLIGL